MATTPDKATKAKTVKTLRVVARTEGFRRAGYAFGAEPRHVPLADLKPEQIAALKAEPQLVVVDDEIEAPADKTAET